MTETIFFSILLIKKDMCKFIKSNYNINISNRLATAKLWTHSALDSRSDKIISENIALGLNHCYITLRVFWSLKPVLMSRRWCVNIERKTCYHVMNSDCNWY